MNSSLRATSLLRYVGPGAGKLASQIAAAPTSPPRNSTWLPHGVRNASCAHAPAAGLRLIRLLFVLAVVPCLQRVRALEHATEQLAATEVEDEDGWLATADTGETPDVCAPAAYRLSLRAFRVRSVHPTMQLSRTHNYHSTIS